MAHKNHNDPHNNSKFHATIRVKLSCGHWVKTRNRPLPSAKFGCTAALGCGYFLAWTEFEDPGYGRFLNQNNRVVPTAYLAAENGDESASDKE